MKKLSKGFTLIRTLLRKNLVKVQQCYGFTLIELLVVIAIVGILSTFTIVAVGGAQEKARDSQRKSDLNQYRIALENYNNTYDIYFVGSGDATIDLCTALGDLISSCPGDPKGGVYIYDGIATDYILYAKLELPNSPTTYWYYCANGKSGTKATTAPSIVDNCDN